MSQQRPDGGSGSACRMNLPAPVITHLLVVVAVAAGALACPGSSLASPRLRTGTPEPVCGAPPTDSATCLAWKLQGATGSASPVGYTPSDLQSAYRFPTGKNAGAGQTVAIVDAYDNPNVEADLAVYRAQFGLPPCTTANGCFSKVGQDGSSNLPHTRDQGWSVEESIDVDMVSAVCPNCHILLVEANSGKQSDLAQGENTAAALGATEISNSYTGPESKKDLGYDAYFNHPGIAITAASGDSGFGGFGAYPAASPYVTAVGGTSLVEDGSTARGWSETAWSGSTSLCSDYEPQPLWQSANTTIASLCADRATADVSAVGDPNTGVAVYDTFGYYNGWFQFGGTSVGTPIIASIYALAGNAAALTGASYAYAHSSALNDVISGTNNNGNSCTSAMCVTQPGWDGPTGLGTPNGTGAF
jgi:subtilase family serine protease